MKIKCPLCDEDEWDNPIQLGYHFEKKHGVFRPYREYAKLLFKIHEKIEDLTKKEFEIRKGYGYNDPEANRLNLMIKELKSLLENK